MRTLNVRLALILLIGGIIVIPGVIVVHKLQIPRIAPAFLQAADRAEEAAEEATDPNVAALEMRSVLNHLDSYLKLKQDNLDQEDYDVMERRALLLAKVGAVLPAYQRLEELLRQPGQEGRSEARKQLVETAMRIGRFEDAVAHLAELLEDTPDDPKLLVQLGVCQLYLGKDRDALRTFARTVRVAPSELDAYLYLAMLLRSPLKQPRTVETAPKDQETAPKGKEKPPVEDEAEGMANEALADKYMEELVRNNPTTGRAYLIRGEDIVRNPLKRREARMIRDEAARKEKTRKALDEAMRYLLKALELSPGDCNTLLAVGRCALSQAQVQDDPAAKNRNLVEAESYADKAIKADTSEANGYWLKYRVKLAANDLDKAEEALNEGIQATGKNSKGRVYLLLQLGDLLTDQGKVEDAEKKVFAELKEIKDFQDPRDAAEVPSKVRFLEARCAFINRQWEKAIRIFEEIRPELAREPLRLKWADYWTGMCYGQRGLVKEQLAAYRRATAADPFFFEARMAMVQALMDQGKYAEAIDELRQGMKGRPPEQVVMTFAKVLLERNRRTRTTDQEWNEVDQLLADAAQQWPEAVLIKQFQAEARIGRACMKEQWETAEEHIERAKKEVKDNARLRLAQADYYLQRYAEAAPPYLKTLTEGLDNFKDEERWFLYLSLVEHFQKANDFDMARRLCEIVLQQQPGNTRARELLLELTLASRTSKESAEKSIAEIEALLAKAAFRDENRVQGLRLYVQAAKLVAQAKDNDPASLDQALDLLKKAETQIPNWAGLPRLAGDIHLRKGEANEALESYFKAIKSGARDLATIDRTARLLCERERFTEACRLLRPMEEQRLVFSRELNSIYADALLFGQDWRDDDLERVQRLLQNSVDAKSSYKDHLWRGRQLNALAGRAKSVKKEELAAKLHKDAEDAFVQAVQLRPDSADCWIAVVRLLAATGQKQAAGKAIEQAATLIDPRNAALALGRCYEAVGDMARAEEKYKAALTADPALAREAAEFYLRAGKPDVAEPLLKKVLDGTVKASAGEKAFARRAMAMVLLDRGGFSNLEAGLALVDENLEITKNSIEDLRAKVRLLVRHPQRSKRQEAAAALEGLGPNRTLEDYFQLAQIYLAQNNWSKYLGAMRSVIASNPKPEHLAYHVLKLLQHNDRADVVQAERLLANLEKLPEPPDTLHLRSLLLFRQNKFDELYDFLMSYMEKTKEEKQHLQRTLLVAGLMEQFGARMTGAGQKAAAARFNERAGTLYRLYADKTPKQELLVATFLASQGQFKEALDLLEGHWETSEAGAVGQAASTVFRAQGATREQMLRAEKILQAALKKFSRPAELLTALATSYTMQQRYAEAETIYREILAKEPENPVVLNNLGVLLALQEKALDEALEYVDKAVSIAGPVATILDSRAVVYIARGEAEKALADLEAAIADDPTPVRLFHQARAYHMAGKKAEATAALQAAEKTLKPAMLDPPERPVYAQLREELGL